MRTKRTYENFVKAVINESKYYSCLRKLNGQFNEKYLKMGFEKKMSARQFCNAILEIT